MPRISVRSWIGGAGLLGIAVVGGSPIARAETFDLASPNGRLQVEIGQSGNAMPQFSIRYDGHDVVLPSPTGFEFPSAPFGASGITLQASRGSVDDRYRPVLGKTAAVADRYNLLTLDLVEPGELGRHLMFEVRAYDGGAAFRYRVPQQPHWPQFVIKAEKTQYRFARDFDCWGANQGRYVNAHEGEFDKVKASQIRAFHLFDMPLVCKTGVGQTTFALAESDVENYPGSFFSGRGDGGLGVEINASPRFDTDSGARAAILVEKADIPVEGLHTPWRVLMIGDQPGALTESALIATLGAPSRIADTSWIQGGKTAWDWWNGWQVDVPHPGINTESYKAYIDFAAAMHLNGILIDEGWSVGSSVEPNPSADVTKPIPAMDIPELVRYAADKGLGVWVWAQWQQMDRQMDAAFENYQAWGLKGVKVDFMNRNDQEMVEFYHRILEKAAAHHLMVDLHGAYPPNGLLRTYPNFITQEGVMGAEYNKWSSRVTATHNVTLPFTRMILGPMDYTPGGFRALTPAEFPSQMRSIAPFVQTTRGQAIAMYVVFDSPLQMVADSPSAYKNADGSWADGADLIQQVPTVWDETQVVAGDIGQYIVTVRRKGAQWYIGAMTNEQGRKIVVPLKFLPKGSFKAHIWQDGADINHLKVTDQTVAANQSLSLTLAPSGGAVVWLQGATTP